MQIREPITLRRGAGNRIELRVLGGWGQGKVSLHRATLRVPPQNVEEYDLEISNGDFEIGPKENRKVVLSFDLPSSELKEREKEDGILTLKFKDGSNARPDRMFIPFNVEHWGLDI